MMRILFTGFVCLLMGATAAWGQQAPDIEIVSGLKKVTLKTSEGSSIWYKFQSGMPIVLQPPSAGNLGLRVRTYVTQGESVQNTWAISGKASAGQLQFESHAKAPRSGAAKKVLGNSSRHTISVQTGTLEFTTTHSGILQFAFTATPAPDANAPPASADSSRAATNAATADSAGGVLLGVRAGYLYGFGELSTPSVDLLVGYRLPLMRGLLEIYGMAGWNTSTQIEQHTDPVLGDYEAEWLLEALPFSLNVAAGLPVGPVRLYGGAGFEAIWTHFRFETRSDLGLIGPQRIETDFALGHRYFGGVAAPLGPGELGFEIRYSASIAKNSFSDITGNFGGLGGSLGYVFVF